MVLDATVKTGGEIRAFLSSGAQSLLSIDLAGTATENVGGTIVWQEIGYLRQPPTFIEPQTAIDIRKRFDIDHTKRGPEERKTGSASGAFTNTGESLRKFLTQHCLLKIEYHVDDAAAVDEYEYAKGIRITTYAKEPPANAGAEVVERIDYIWSDYGKRSGP